MKQHGFSLVELVLIVAIIGTLLSIAALEFSKMNRKSGLESQVKKMYADLMTAKLDAMRNRKKHLVSLGANQYTIRNYSSAADLVGTQILQNNLAYPLSWSDGGGITFDTRGFANYSSSNTRLDKSICVHSGVTPGVDSIVLTATSINMGILTNQTGACDSGNITIKE